MDVSSVMKTLVNGLGDIQSTHYAQLASSTIILFDHFITFDEEVNLIWGSSWSLGKVLFLINRYYSLCAVILNNYGFFTSTLTDSLCVKPSSLVSQLCVTNNQPGLRFFQWQGWTGLVGCMLAEAILQMRLYALYSLNKKVLALMLISFAASSAAAGWIMGTVLANITARATTIPGGKFCVPIGVSDQFYAFWIPLLGFESLLCILALVRGFQTFRSDGSLFRSGRQLVSLLIRDSVLYFLAICSTYVTCLLVWIFGRPSLLEVPIGFSVAMSCVLANRIILNVRAVSKEVEDLKSESDLKNRTVKGWETSFCSPGSISQFDRVQLRSMCAERPVSDILDYYHGYGWDEDVPWKVL